MNRRPLLRPERQRTVERPFGWLACRMLTNGTIAAMSPSERQLYLVLALAADRNGVSFYSDSAIRCTLGFTGEQLLEARSSLVARDLLAYDGLTYQLLSLPGERIDAIIDRQRVDQQSIALASRPTDKKHPQAMPGHIREVLREIFGRKSF